MLLVKKEKATHPIFSNREGYDLLKPGKLASMREVRDAHGF